ncbi:MAG: hypothetical protein A3F72_01785 [Bacteroidetes bacterium RIFCSPLOWO2_12_FULL_35_15]|nr:MAG: hypothetical protein A3F72_01785 [Bacteroidetes bacterium RIFCSPLOWO2_12_FULL_35_15]
MKYEDSLKYSLAKNQIPLFLLDKNFDNDHSGFWPTLSDTIHFKSYIINRINSCTELNKLNELIDSVNSVNKNEVDSVIMKDLKERQLSLGCNLIR